MRYLCLVVLFTACLCPDGRADDSQADAARLRGEWTVVEGMRAGRAFAKKDLRRWRVVFHDPRKNLGMHFVELPSALCADGVRLYSGSWGGPPLGGALSYQLSAKGSLRRILLSERPVLGSDNQNRAYAGIYELDGDRLKLCLNLGPWEKADSPARTAWPEKLEAPRGSGFTLLSLRREGPAK